MFAEGGTFIMGGGDVSDDMLRGEDELPAHSITLDSFEIAKYETTHEEVFRVLSWALKGGKVWLKGNTGKGYGAMVYLSAGKKKQLLRTYIVGVSCDDNGLVLKRGWENHPCSQVTWYGAAAYCNFRSEMEGLAPCYDMEKGWECNFKASGYRLPTEAEWEYAARGGASGRGTIYSGSDSLEDVGWCNQKQTTVDYRTTEIKIRQDDDREQPVGTKEPNELGIYDMSGNVSEWCNDWYGEYDDKAQTNPVGEKRGKSRVVRGGSYIDSPQFCRVSARRNEDPDRGVSGLGLPDGGFRVVKPVPKNSGD